jgi:hypothetical protein
MEHFRIKPGERILWAFLMRNSDAESQQLRNSRTGVAEGLAAQGGRNAGTLGIVVARTCTGAPLFLA